jgi:hypothetical protein
MSETHPLIRARVRLSDLHMSEGAVLPDGSPNPLEDFKDADGYERLLDGYARRHPPDITLELFWGGDIMDFNPIRWRGSFRIMPTEEAAVGELESCFRGHPRIWDATSLFLAAAPNRTLVILIGNHDLPFVWPMVQERIRARLLPREEWHRIRFVYGEELDGEVLHIHGDVLDPLNANPSERELFITASADRGPIAASILATVIGIVTARGLLTGVRNPTWWRFALIAGGLIAAFMLFGALFRKFTFWRSGQDARFLNMPYGTHLDTWLVSALKKRFPWFGRTTDAAHYLHKPVDLSRNWRYVALMLPMTFIHLLWHRFFRDLVDARRKAGFLSTIRLFAVMTKPPNIKRLLWKILDRHPQAKVVIVGHFHIPAVHTLRNRERQVVFIDGGTGIEQIGVDLAEGGFFARLAHYWRARPKRALFSTFLACLIASLPFGLNLVTGWREGVFDFVMVSLTFAGLVFVQAHALYEKGRYTVFTPVETLTYADGSQTTRLLRFNPAAGTDPFRGFLDP